MSAMLLHVEHLKTAYKSRDGQYVHAVDDVSFDLEEGGTMGIAGESGCGKSTLALSLMGYYFPPLTYLGGRICLDDRDIMQLPYETLRKEVLGRKLAYIPQAAMNALNPTKRIIQFVRDILSEHGQPVSKKEAEKMLSERFSLLGLPERVIHAYPNELSGGMKQRVVIGVSTILSPQLLIADEPTSALDVTSQKVVIQMMNHMLQLGIVKSIIYITHELPLLRHITKDIMVMYAGRIVEKGSTEQVVFDPLHPYTKALMDSIIVPEADTKNRRIAGLQGSPPSLKSPAGDCRFAQRCSLCGKQCPEHRGEYHYLEDEKRSYLCDLSPETLREVHGNG